MDFPGRCLLRELGSVCSFFPCFPMFAFSHFYSIFNLISLLRLLVNVAWNFCEPTRAAYFHRHYEEPMLSRGGVSVWQRPGRLSSSCNVTLRARLLRKVSCLWTPLEAHHSCNRIQRYPKAFSSKQLWVSQMCVSHLLYNKTQVQKRTVWLPASRIVRIYTEMGRNGVRRTEWGNIWTVPIQMLGLLLTMSF